ncbi:MAG TPA: CDP-glycerol glycerophosphotransferase family protein [Galbitalea sp.]|nr:CDP-glycerol glycerophosphotransferase family protein [Galbitalea sp.]
MSRFTFAAGNARKVLALPLYGLGTLASFVVPRSRGLWVFGSGVGIGEGALALLLYVRARDPALRLVWLTRNERDDVRAHDLGISTARVSSPRGFWLTLRARAVVVTHGFGDANRFGTRGAFVVQLWHGIPFKHIHLDSPETLRIPMLSRFSVVRRSVRRAYERSGRGIRMFATASPLAAARIRTAFGLSADRVVVTGDPRDDILATETRDGARASLAALLGMATLPPRVLLYAPTWRDGDIDPVIPVTADWTRIASYLQGSDSLLLVRSHPLGAGDYSAGVDASPRIRMIGSNLQADMAPLLPAVDTLITDYSSIAFDYALVGGGIVFLAPDVLEYSASRGVYELFSDFSGGDEVTSWGAAIDLLEKSDRSPAARERMVSHSRWLAARVHSFSDGGNTERVYEQIEARLNGTELPPQPERAPSLVIESLDVTASTHPAFVVTGTFTGRKPIAVRLTGTRSQLLGTLSTSGATWSATVPLLTSHLAGPELPPPSGRYRFRVMDEDHRVLDVAAPSRLEARLVEKLFRVSMPASDDSVLLDFTAPLADREMGKANQSRLRAAYRASKSIVPGSVFFESYYGQNASSNPRGIDRALAAVAPDVKRMWSIVDASVEVPSGAVAIIEGSEAWWQARASAQLIIINDWLRKRFKRRRGQTVLQTWHGTPLKRIALDRPGTRLRAALASRRESSYWNLMLAQNDFSANVFRSAYAFKRPIWQEGYPRDDSLEAGSSPALRKRLGIPARATVILYAPTWRDDRPGKVDHLDVASFSKEIGPNCVTLIRGHSRTLRPGADVVADGVLDVTSYPDISDLFLVADVLITDYSSVMFDFSVTGKPIYFFTPDLAHYRDELRGFYFDLLAEAPGPVISDAAELVRRIRNPGPAEFADRYAAWRAKFNPRDDGHAGERVVTRLMADHLLTLPSPEL